ncbi:MAG TPA: hypothetical protein VMT30_03540, partial [Candidatus Saccharimonadia bacterium]|nr:hypothetical protein [Candidatus Saccharimonadia bacterium]
MKRRWFAVFLMVFANIAALVSYAPPVHADASGVCPPNTRSTSCVTLIVNLTPAPTANATVHAHREQALNADDDFDLHAVNPGQYTSGSSIAFSYDSSPNCSNNAFGAENYFDITVSGSATGSATRINMCNRESPQADDNDIKTISVPVTVGGGGPGGGSRGPGGITGHLTITTAGGATVDCPAASAVDLAGPTPKSTPVGGGGVFNTGLTLTTGTYTLTAICNYLGNPYNFTVNNIFVRPGAITDIGTKNVSRFVNTHPPLVVKKVVGCDAGPGFTWFICGAIRIMMSVVDTIRDKVIVPFLKEPPLDSSSPDYKTAFGIWGTFRNLASVFFILIFFLIVIGTAAGFDNYT